MLATEPSPKIGCVVVTFDRYNELAKTLEAIARQGIDWSDIIVINNNSSDGTVDFLSKHFPNVVTLNLTENIASAGGFSKGLEYAHKSDYDWVWLFNDDSRPVQGTLQSVIPYLVRPPVDPMGLIKISNTDDKGRATLLFWNGARKPVNVPISQTPIETDLITFDGCLVSRKLMDSIGYCDPNYFMGTYEFDYCLKAKDAGFRILTLPNGLLEDGKLGSVKGTPPWRQYYNTRNHLWLGLNRKSPQIIFAWLIRELKYTYSILRFSDRKFERMLFKLRAVRDAVFNRRGKRYDPILYG